MADQQRDNHLADGQTEHIQGQSPWATETLHRWVPAIGSLRGYTASMFQRDFFAGITVAAVAVPQAIAYAKIFGMPAEMGLYTAIVMTTVGAMLDSSKQLINGPTNAISIAMLSALASIDGDERRRSAAILMALLIGLIQTAISLGRFGDLSRFISKAVIVGFTLGASVLLLMDQLKNVLGLQVTTDPHDHFLVRFWKTISASDGVHWPTFCVALSTATIALAMRWINRRFSVWLPEFLIAIVAVSVGLYWIDPARELQVKLTENVPRQLPWFSLPTWDWMMVRELSGSALAIAFLGLLEAMAMAKSIASKTGEKLDMNQQCLSEGLANTVGSFFNCFPGSGSLTRTYINHSSGAATQWSGVISAAGVAATILLFAPFAAYIPRPALAAILVLTAFRMTEVATLKYIAKATRFDALILAITALSAILVSVEFCILIGVALSFALYIPKAAKISMTELAVTTDRVIREVQPQNPRCSLIRIYNLEGELFFGSAPDFEDLMDSIQEQAESDWKVIILRLKRARNPDSVCMQILEKFVTQMHNRGVTVMLSGVDDEMLGVLANVGMFKLIGASNVFREESEIWASTIQALKAAYRLIGPNRCANCPNHPEHLDASDWSYMI
ncbi:MAG: SulP family inorganic anion transporter [Planctomycetota bacterium]